MIYDDPNTAESSISSDLDSLIRFTKTQEEDCLHMNELIDKVLTQRSEIQNSIYIHDEINQYKHIIQKQLMKQSHYQLEVSQLLNNHPKNMKGNEKINVLLKRVAQRTLQIISNTVTKARHKTTQLCLKFTKLKSSCQKILTDDSDSKSWQIIRSITQFTANNLSKLVNTLKIITENLQNGNLAGLQKLKEEGEEHQNQNMIAINSSTKQNRGILLDSFRNRVKIPEKKIENGKEQEKQNQSTRYNLYKKARKIMDSFKDVIEFDRQDFVQGFIEIRKDNKEKAIKELKARNEVNQRQISAFIDKKTHKRNRILTSAPFESKSQNDKTEQSKTDVKNQSNCFSARKSLLLKFKQNQYRERTITSEFFRKINRVEQSKLKGKYTKKPSKCQLNDLQKRKDIIMAIQNIICQNEELQLKASKESCSKFQQKLPPLNKRSMSVDQNYRTESNQQATISNTSKGVSSSAKESHCRIKRTKLQRSQICPAKVKIEMKGINSLLNHEANNKIINLTDMNKQVWF